MHLISLHQHPLASIALYVIIYYWCNRVCLKLIFNSNIFMMFWSFDLRSFTVVFLLKMNLCTPGILDISMQKLQKCRFSDQFEDSDRSV